MILDLDVSLDYTLGCGQAHRWRRTGGAWEGVIDGHLIVLRQRDGGVEARGGLGRDRVLDYLRVDDDLTTIYSSFSSDPLLKRLGERYQGLRLLRQDPWECLATYMLAVNANVKRIGDMVENVCDAYGTDLGGRRSFPSPERIAEDPTALDSCRLGYRCQRLGLLAASVADGELDPWSLRGVGYQHCIDRLKSIHGVGDKVADCVSLFSLDHLQAFPVDARIKRCLKERYGVMGPYPQVSAFGRERFGEFAGYAQELLYQSMGDPLLSDGQMQAGGL